MDPIVTLDPQTRAAIESVAQQARVALPNLSPAEGRRVHAERLRRLQGKPEAPASIKELDVCCAGQHAACSSSAAADAADAHKPG